MAAPIRVTRTTLIRDVMPLLSSNLAIVKPDANLAEVIEAVISIPPNVCYR